MSQGWCTIESDPGVFTELIQEMGVKDAQVEELYALDDSTFDEMKPIYGLIFLFKWRSGERDDRPTIENPEFFFAHQVINNACATQAILSVLLNVEGLELGSELSNFKGFTKDLPPDMKGLAISNSDLIKRVHNSFARPEPFVMESKAAREEDDIFHFIAYMPIKGRLYELDGLKHGPIDLGICTTDDWLSRVQPVITKRIEKYSRSEIRFNLMAIVRNKKYQLQQQVLRLEAEQAQLRHRLGLPPAGPAPMEVESPAAEAKPSALEGLSPEQLQKLLQENNDHLSHARAKLEVEEEKYKAWKHENIRRRHNYVPFLVNLIKILAEKGELVPLINKAKEKEKKANK
jgi:ubiquitin carboxyl-terminal hydrolase L5